MGTIIMVAQLLLGLSILVGLHEMGHFLAAKAFGMRVEKFSIGFPPKIWARKFGETEYSFGAIPLGGFVKITGMVDESLDVKSLESKPQPWEFRAKPAWQRLIVMLGGIFVNIITGLLIFSCIKFIYGDVYISKEVLNIDGIYATDLGESVGLKTGDKILALNGEDYQRFSDLIGVDAILGDSLSYTIERNGIESTVIIPDGFINRLSDKGQKKDFIGYRTKFRIGKVPKESHNYDILLPDDSFLKVNDQDVEFFDEFATVLGENKNNVVQAVVNRGGQEITLEVGINKDGKMLFHPELLIETKKEYFSFLQSIGLGTIEAFSVISTQIKAFGKIFTGKLDASKSIQGPVGIAQMFGNTWDWSRFWGLLGLLSMVLAFMNLLPIPALDGGHVVFLSYEMISGHKPNDKFLENAQKAGMVIILCLLVFAFYNDIANAISRSF